MSKRINLFFVVSGIGLAFIGAGIDGWIGAGVGWLVGSIGGMYLSDWAERLP